MNSTKITEHDMDDSVFNGLAQESTSQEILDAVNNMETSLAGELTANVVKSVQRQFTTLSASSKEITLTISAVNPEKCSVNFYTNRSDSSSGVAIVGFTETKVSFKKDYTASYNDYVMLEIIEYY